MRDLRAHEGLAPMVLLLVVSGGAVLQLAPGIQSRFLTSWMDVGLGGALFILFMLLEDLRRPHLRGVDRWHWLLLLVYLVHQFEEHGVDLLGRSYSFMAYANGILSEMSAGAGPQLDELSIYRINTLMIWIPFLVAIWGGRRYDWPGFFAGALVLVNGFLHVALAIARGEYNPGLATSLALFLPVSGLYFRQVWKDRGRKPVLIATALGLAGHAALPVWIRLGDTPAGDAPSLGVLGAIALAPLAANWLWVRGTEVGGEVRTKP